MLIDTELNGVTFKTMTQKQIDALEPQPKLRTDAINFLLKTVRHLWKASLYPYFAYSVREGLDNHSHRWEGYDIVQGVWQERARAVRFKPSSQPSQSWILKTERKTSPEKRYSFSIISKLLETKARVTFLLLAFNFLIFSRHLDEAPQDKDGVASDRNRPVSQVLNTKTINQEHQER